MINCLKKLITSLFYLTKARLASEKSGYLYHVALGSQRRNWEERQVMVKLQDIRIEGTSKTPQVSFVAGTGNLTFKGKSLPENASGFFEPLYKWASEYSKNPAESTNLKFNVDYFNTSSVIWMGKILKVLTKIKKADHILFVHLYFDIEEYDSMGEEHVRESLSPFLDVTADATCSVGIRLYGIDDDGNTLKENIVLI
jgi:hypothetical protein